MFVVTTHHLNNSSILIVVYRLHKKQINLKITTQHYNNDRIHFQAAHSELRSYTRTCKLGFGVATKSPSTPIMDP